MTAPLPPLPKFLVALLPHEERAMQSYAKLAVRQALERAAKRLEARDAHEEVWWPSKCASAIRAMIEEYK